MSRIIRSVLAVGAGAAAIAASVTFAVAGEPAQRAEPVAAAAPAAVQLQAQHSGQCLTVPSGSLRNGVNAVQSACAEGAENQQFDLKATGAGTLEVQFKHAGKCLDVEGAGIKTGTVVQQWWCVGQQQQRWRLIMVDIAKELYELRPAHLIGKPGRCLEIKSSAKDDGAIAQLYACNGTSAQQWRIKPVSAV
ncbi:RICIN domain-containing protein [Streptomyces sp. NBC_00239]|uniref:RICIN domain-containing protein n=1 Tax=Streptomyces sp. NBC_00239 TaxID=2903640 RepID=UPI002E281F0B|nr:RICIN domain-containing protein [Streptomyces sp. NBC_00239]